MLKTRIITALLLIAVLLPILFLSSNMVWASVTLMLSLLAVNEWGKLINLAPKNVIYYTIISAILGLGMLRAMTVNGFHWLIYQSLFIFVLTLLFWLLVVPILLTKLVIIKNQYFFSVIGLFLICPLWLALICLKGIDPWLLLTLLMTIWVADTAAYFFGKYFGKHKLAPSISPGKTWEGVVGALIGVTLLGGIIYFNTLVSSWAIFILLWLVASLGVVGDLFESLVKRQMDKKDSGNLLPGHGGILDRIDGLIPSLPIAVLIIYLFNYFQVGH
jgi:phosphatidate cytidylyltransferase